MTRKQILKDFNLDPTFKRILDPGKFEGEAIYVPYFYDAYLNGEQDWTADDRLAFEVTAEDAREFPELNAGNAILLDITDQGLVESEFFPNKKEAERAIDKSLESIEQYHADMEDEVFWEDY